MKPQKKKILAILISGCFLYGLYIFTKIQKPGIKFNLQSQECSGFVKVQIGQYTLSVPRNNSHKSSAWNWRNYKSLRSAGGKFFELSDIRRLINPQIEVILDEGKALYKYYLWS